MKNLYKATAGVLFLLLSAGSLFAQSEPARALDNVQIQLADGSVIQSGTIVWRDGVIEGIGRNIDIPFDARVIDAGDSLYVYPGFIDGLAHWGSPDLPENFDKPDRPGEPGYERAGIQPQRSPLGHLEGDQEAFAKALENGFTTAALGLKGFMLPGQIELYLLDKNIADEHRYKKGFAFYGQFEEAPGEWGNGAYPGTQMGVMARFRQLMYDAEALNEHTEYYASNTAMPAPKGDEVLESLFPLIDREQPLYFKVDDKEDIERLFWLQDEFGFDLVLVSGKEAYAKSDELRERGIPVLASVELPEQPEWMADDADEKEELSEEQQHYRERRKEAYDAYLNNIRNLLDAGVEVGFASHGLSQEMIKKHNQTLIEEEILDDEELLRLFTLNTASILGVEEVTGDLREGHLASFSVFTKPFTDEEAEVRYAVSNGSVIEF